MKFISPIAIVLFLFFLPTLVVAQNGHTDSLALKETRILKRKLALSDTQYAQVLTIQTQLRNALDSLRNQSGIGYDAIKTSCANAYQQYELSLEGILSTHQRTLYHNEKQKVILRIDSLKN